VTALELIAAVESAGGKLAPHGEKLRCTLPRAAAHLLPALREEKPAILELLGQRASQNHSSQISSRNQARNLPWPGYNGGRQFSCEQCLAHFDTSVGVAKHQVNGCHADEAREEASKTLPRCPACGSYALYRERSGMLSCQTCRRQVPEAEGRGKLQ
jgi:hypothetical protein